MRMNALWGGIVTVLLPAAAFYLTASPGPSLAQQGGSFFLQEDGEVSVMRGTSEEANFEPATIAPEDEEVPEAQEQVLVQPTAPVVTPERGIVTHRTGRNTRVRDRLGGRTPKSGIRTHRAGTSDDRNIRVLRAGSRERTVNR